MPGNCPDGYVDVQQFDTWTEIPGDDPRKVRAVVTYDRPLTAAELARYSLSQVGGGRLEPDVEYICHAVDAGEGFDLGGWSLEATTDGWTLTGPEGVVDADMLSEVAVATTIDHLLP